MTFGSLSPLASCAHSASPTVPRAWQSAYTLAQMPLVSEDRSSVISEPQKVCIISRDGGMCVLCGMDPVDVVHIVARNSAAHRQVSETGWHLQQLIKFHTGTRRLIGSARWHRHCRISGKTMP